MAQPLIYEYRGEILENIHHGDICVIDKNGTITHQVGNPHKEVYFRSSSKPFQVLPLLLHGGEEAFHLTEEEIVIMSASHTGQPDHIRVLEGLLKKTGIQEDQLIMLPALPDDPNYRDLFLSQGASKRKLYHNCSGKHMALMLLARLLGENEKNYWKIKSKAQQEVLKTMAIVSETPIEEIKIGLDGCGVPVFSSTLQGIAKAYRLLALPDMAESQDLAKALRKVQNCIAKYPYLMRGTGYACGEINTDSVLVGKGGACGVYGFGVKSTGMAVSFKMEDGAEDTLPLVLATILEQLSVGSKQTRDTIASFAGWEVRNSANQIAARREAVFNVNNR